MMEDQTAHKGEIQAEVKHMIEQVEPVVVSNSIRCQTMQESL
jgi:hypothetical protein